MNPKRKRKVRSDSGKASAADNPSPFELAQIAIALFQLHKKERHGYYLQCAHYFSAAKKLLDDARDYLEIDWKEHADNVTDALFSRFPKNQTFSFDELLQPSGEESKGKKSRTWIGTITTQNGLEKAIRRYFSRLEAARIIQSGRMTGNERNVLLEAQKRAVQQRAAKRVKNE
jgi:hypothetical protein